MNERAKRPMPAWAAKARGLQVDESVAVARDDASEQLDAAAVARALRESLLLLLKDVPREEYLQGAKQLADLFSQTTVSGKVLHDFVTTSANLLAPVFTRTVVPIVRASVLQSMIGLHKVGIAVLEAREADRQASAGDEPILTTDGAIDVVKKSVDGISMAAVVVVRGASAGLAVTRHAIRCVRRLKGSSLA